MPSINQPVLQRCKGCKMMSQITITPIKDKVFGAVVTDISLPNLSDVEFKTVKAAFLKYGFLVFPQQFLTDEENIAFG